MSLQLLIDHCVPDDIADELAAIGHDVVRLRQILPINSNDRVIIEMALETNRILLTMDQDFADILSYPPKRFLGILFLSPNDDLSAVPGFIRQLRKLIADLPSQAEYAGKLFIVEPFRIRYRV